MGDITCLTGPIEKVDGRLLLRIPLASGGSELASVARGISVVEGEFLKVAIPDWLAEKLGLVEGTLVTVDNANGKFTIRPC